jgi:hypothetical protein
MLHKIVIRVSNNRRGVVGVGVVIVDDDRGGREAMVIC